MTSGGLDHEVVAGGPGTVIRRRRPGADGLDVESEAALLRVVRPVAPLPVPRVLRTWPAEGAMELERVPGVPLLARLPSLGAADAVRIGGELGDLVAALALVPRTHVEHLVPVDVPDVEELLAEAADSWEQVRAEVPDRTRTAVDAFLTSRPELVAPEPVLVHQDLGAEHVFVDGAGRITGVIDWSDSVLGDPAVDLGLVLRDLGETALECALARFVARGPGSDELLPRARFHARVRALEDLAYGTTENASTYRDNARRAVTALFGPVT
jgi:aminoglycoside phosphotransferase (APT) family kinase protein